MKNKLFSIIALIFMVFFGFTLKAEAMIYSENDIQETIQKLETLSSYDFSSLISKSELIGFRLQNFNMSSQLYTNSIIITTDNLRNILTQIELIKNSEDFSQTQKDMQINRLFYNANSALFELDTRTMSYLMDLRISLPTITYENYLKDFQNLYNQLNLTGFQIKMNRK